MERSLHVEEEMAPTDLTKRRRSSTSLLMGNYSSLFAYGRMNFKVSIAVVLILTLKASSYILRLPCKQMASYSIRKEGMVLQNALIASYTHVSQGECEIKCLDQWNCKSINIKLAGNQSCELNNKTPEDIRDRVSLSVKPGWLFLTTDYKNQWVGENCRNVKPCEEGVLCTDTCVCPGFKCHKCQNRQYGLHCYDPMNDCEDVYKTGVRRSGVYPITTTYQSLLVYCNLLTANTGWIVIQRRVDGTKSFDQNWAEYKKGFGNITQNYWMGLDNIHKLAGPGRGAVLRIDMVVKQSYFLKKRYAQYAQYDKFEVGSEAVNFSLSLGNYTGTATDAMKNCKGYSGYSQCSADGMMFSTKDNDNDQSVDNCAKERGGWWHNSCSSSDLNAPYPTFSNYGYSTYWLWQRRPVIYSEMKIKYN